MLKQRSLFPSFGKFSPYGRSYNTYILRKPVAGQTVKDRLIQEHANGLAASGDHPSTFANYVMGLEKFSSTEHYYRDNWCDHSKVYRLNMPFTHGYVNSSGRYAMFLFNRFNPANWTFPSVISIAEQHNANLGKVGDDLRAQAYWDMRPKFEGEVSMLNFLYELKDFREIAKTLTRPNGNPLVQLYKALKGHKKSQEAVASGVKDALGSPTKSLAEAHLVNAFAVQPLISDLTAIFTQLGKMVADAEREFSDNGVGNTRHWSSQLDPVATWTGDSVSSTIVYRFGSSLQSTYTFTAKQRYSYTPRSKLNAFCTHWGLVPNLEVIWNALPFSFLVDYFLSVGKSLNRMRTDPNVTAYSMSDCVESVLTKYDTGRFIARGQQSDGHMGIVLDDTYYSSIPYSNPKLIDGYTCSFYTRMLGIQPYYGPPLPKLKVPKAGQFVNMAALARCMF